MHKTVEQQLREVVNQVKLSLDDRERTIAFILDIFKERPEIIIPAHTFIAALANEGKGLGIFAVTIDLVARQSGIDDRASALRHSIELRLNNMQPGTEENMMAYVIAYYYWLDRASSLPQ